jgi:hypothetical protein
MAQNGELENAWNEKHLTKGENLVTAVVVSESNSKSSPTEQKSRAFSQPDTPWPNFTSQGYNRPLRQNMFPTSILVSVLCPSAPLFRRVMSAIFELNATERPSTGVTNQRRADTFVNYVYTIKITQQFKQLNTPFFVIYVQLANMSTTMAATLSPSPKSAGHPRPKRHKPYISPLFSTIHQFQESNPPNQHGLVTCYDADVAHYLHK